MNSPDGTRDIERRKWYALEKLQPVIDAVRCPDALPVANQIGQCGTELQRLLGARKMHELPDDGMGAPKRGAPARNSVRCDARAALFEASAVDLTRIPGIDASTALKVISEIGVDLQPFPTGKHFTSWMV